MLAALKPGETTGDRTTKDACRHDLRLELKARNNVLYHAIFDQYGSIRTLCEYHPDLKNQITGIYALLRFKINPKKVQFNIQSGEKCQTAEYRKVCRLLETALGTPVQELFPHHLYDYFAVTKVDRVIVVRSFSALPRMERLKIWRSPAPDEESPPVQAEKQELRERMQIVLKTISYREREIISLLYGISDGYCHGMEEVAHIFRIGKERVRQIEQKAIRKLQQPSRSQELLPFLKDK